jgi:hypothetical protein
MTLADAHQAHQEAVRHAEGSPPPATPPPAPPDASCARCGGPLPARSSGRPARGARYCSRTCRFADVRERRAAARSDLLAALDQLAEVARRVENALRTLGLRPTHPRAPRRKAAP